MRKYRTFNDDPISYSPLMKQSTSRLLSRHLPKPRRQNAKSNADCFYPLPPRPSRGFSIANGKLERHIAHCSHLLLAQLSLPFYNASHTILYRVSYPAFYAIHHVTRNFSWLRLVLYTDIIHTKS